MKGEGVTITPNLKPRKPWDQLSRHGKWRRRIAEEDPERHEEMKRRKRERHREKMLTDPEYGERRTEISRRFRARHPEIDKRHKARQKERYHEDPQYRDHILSYKREWYAKQRDRDTESYRRQQRVNKRYNLIYQRYVRLELIRLCGDACESCYFSDVRALEVHHLDDDKSEDHHGDYRKMLRGEMAYQVLCASCHRIETYTREQLSDVPSCIFYRTLRNELIQRRGGACERCICYDIRCLELHHPNEDASEDRRDDLIPMRDGEIEYEVLCANCHRIEHYEPFDVMPLTLRQAELLLQVS